MDTHAGSRVAHPVRCAGLREVRHEAFDATGVGSACGWLRGVGGECGVEFDGPDLNAFEAIRRHD